MDHYILNDDHTITTVPDLLSWGQWMETANRIVAFDTLPNGTTVSTVFLGLDHSFGDGDNTPVLFETMIFGGDNDEYQRRYCTWDQAVAGHKKALAKA